MRITYSVCRRAIVAPLFLAAIGCFVAAGASAQTEKASGPASTETKADPQFRPAPAPTPAPSSKTAPTKLSRWFELQTGTTGVRYRSIENSAGVRTASQIQDSGQFKARFKFDPRARLTVNATYSTGNSFTGGWNTTGIGTGAMNNHWYLKQLYAAWVPIPGVEISYGSMGFVRGESTEITTYDNDGYLTGERLSVKRPREFYFDEFGVTRAYLGDTSKPSVTNRFSRLFGGRNYYQVFASKRIGKALALSADFTSVSGVSTWHGAATLRTPFARAVDLVRFEQYSRRGGSTAGWGFNAYGEKTLFKRVTIGFGYATIDPLAPTLNADRFARGKRVYESLSVKVLTDVTLQLFYTQALHNTITIPNKRRLDVIVSYNVLSGLQRLGLFK